MPTERDVPAEHRHLPDEGAGTPLPVGRGRRLEEPTTEWRPAEEFPRAAIDEALARPSDPLAEHPVYGTGFAWELVGSAGEPTRLEIFPDRRWASVVFVDASLRRQERGVILDYLAVHGAGGQPALTMVSAREGRATLINVYPSGEVDEFFRLQAEGRALPPEALIFAAPAAAPAVGPIPREQPALTVVEAARQLGTGPENVRVLLRSRRLPGFKRGGAWYVPAGALAEFQAARRRR
jgi:hypothetical protein